MSTSHWRARRYCFVPRPYKSYSLYRIWIKWSLWPLVGKFWQYVEEVDFGPGLLVHNVIITGQLVAGDQNLPCFLMSAFINLMNW